MLCHTNEFTHSLNETNFRDMTGEGGIVEDDSIGTDLGLFLSTLLLQRKK